MAKLSLKNIIGKKNANTVLLLSLMEQLKADVFIEDEQEKFLVGNNNALITYSHPILLDEEILGRVKGDDKAECIASLLSLLAQKDVERKKLGSEILALYQEVNMVFNFSDKLAQAIDPNTIAQITLEEAMHLIKSNSGLVVLWDETTKQLQVPA